MGTVLSYCGMSDEIKFGIDNKYYDYKYLEDKTKYYDIMTYRNMNQTTNNDFNEFNAFNELNENNSKDTNSEDIKPDDVINSSMEYVKCYNLYIYIDPDLPLDIKQNYINNAIKHNQIVDAYFNSLDSSEFDTLCFDSGFDLFCPTDTISYGTQSLILDHKVKCCMKCDRRYVGYYLYSRSSTASRTPLRLANSVGVIDSGYRGNIIAMFDNVKDYDFMEYDVTCGHRYTQICPPNLEYPMRVYIVENESDLGKETARGNGGFGSTGN